MDLRRETRLTNGWPVMVGPFCTDYRKIESMVFLQITPVGHYPESPIVTCMSEVTA